MSFLFVYVTAPSHAEAVNIARAVVEARLTACANVFPSVSSIYLWQGRVETVDQCVLVLKTKAALFDELAAFVRVRHPYECPCIVALDLAKATPDFLEWIESSVKTESSMNGEL